MVTINDYYAHQADFQAQVDIDEINVQLNRVLEWQGCKQSYNSEWYYSMQCRGIVAEPSGYSEWWELRPVEVVESDMQMWCDYDFMRSWQRHYYRLCWIGDQMERWEDLRNDLDYQFGDDMDYDTFNAIWDTYDRFYTMFVGLYADAYEEAIEDLCYVAQTLMRECCDYAYSDEAAEDWVEFMNAEEAWLNEQQAERDFEDMVGQTARYEGWAA